MFKSSKIKVLISLLFIFSIFFIISPTKTAEAVDAVDVVKNASNFYFLGATGIPAGLIVSGLQYFEVVPEPKEGNDDFIFSSIIKSVVVLMKWISLSLLNFGQGTLTYVIDGGFTSMQVTDFNPESDTYNPLVATGWGIARNLANAALVIGLIIIAINIILGREENKAKKTLINFIIIALLINFTPVLCGFIIDGSNIITKSFMTGGMDSSFNNLIIKNWDKLDGLNLNDMFLTGISLCIFTLYSFYLYILYALLFAARYVMLWILVMASPIAFATKVFPQSKYIKKIFPSILYWDDWLESFAQWCVIGIPAGLFIYLSNIMMQNAPAISAASNSTNDIVGNVIGSLFVYFIPLLFLLAGFFICISAGGQVGSYLGGVAKNSISGAWAKTGGMALGRAKELTTEGSIGLAGAALASKNPLNFENRETARLSFKEAIDNILPPDPSKDKDAAQDYLKKHPAAYNLRTRSSLQASSINKDFADDIDNAKTKEELETLSRNAKNYLSPKKLGDFALKLSGRETYREEKKFIKIL
jgi:hypothetical protein